MATLKSFNEDDDEQGGGGAAVISGGGAGTGGNNAVGTNWTNLSNYLDASKGSGVGQQMANQITENTKKDVDRLEGSGNAVSSWQENAKKEADAATKQDNYSNTIKNGTLDDINKIDNGAFDNWKKLASYTGATNAQQTNGYNKVAQDVYNTKNQIQNLGSYEGQKQALANTYGTQGNYGRGMQALDAFAMRGDAEGQKNLQAFQQANSGFGNKFDSAVRDVNDYTGSAKDRGQAAADTVTRAVADRYGSLKSAADVKAAQARTQDTSAFDQANKDVRASYDPYGSMNANGYSYNGLLDPTKALSSAIQTQEGDLSAYYDDAELTALNQLAGFDDTADTSTIAKGKKNSASIDQALIDADKKAQIGAINDPLFAKAGNEALKSEEIEDWRGLFDLGQSSGVLGGINWN